MANRLSYGVEFSPFSTPKCFYSTRNKGVGSLSSWYRDRSINPLKKSLFEFKSYVSSFAVLVCTAYSGTRLAPQEYF